MNWSYPYAATAIEAGPIWQPEHVSRAVAGITPRAQRMAAKNPVPMFGGFGYSPQQQAQIGRQMQSGLETAGGQQALGFERMAAPANAQFAMQSEQARSQAGLRGAQFGQGRQLPEIQQRDALMRMLMNWFGGLLT